MTPAEKMAFFAMKYVFQYCNKAECSKCVLKKKNATDMHPEGLCPVRTTWAFDDYLEYLDDGECFNEEYKKELEAIQAARDLKKSRKMKTDTKVLKRLLKENK